MTWRWAITRHRRPSQFLPSRLQLYLALSSPHMYDEFKDLSLILDLPWGPWSHFWNNTHGKSETFSCWKYSREESASRHPPPLSWREIWRFPSAFSCRTASVCLISIFTSPVIYIMNICKAWDLGSLGITFTVDDLQSIIRKVSQTIFPKGMNVKHKTIRKGEKGNKNGLLRYSSFKDVFSTAG